METPADTQASWTEPDYSDGLGFTVPEEASGQRLDRLLALQFPDQSRARLQRWIEAGAVSLNGRWQLKPSQIVQAGQKVWAIPPEPEPAGDWLAENIPLDILFEDSAILVVNKPAGLVVHPAAGHSSGTLLNALLWHAPTLRELPRAGIVHRLDRDTTGLMVIAKTLEAQTNLVRQLQDRSMGRHYIALSWGLPRQPFVVEGLIGRDPRDRQRMAMVSDSGGKPSWTAFEPLEKGTLENLPVTLLGCTLKTGRTHQIRVHLQHAGFPIVGDPVYHRGAPRAPQTSLSRQALHAKSLHLTHPVSLAPVTFEAPAPADLAQLFLQAAFSCQS